MNVMPFVWPKSQVLDQREMANTFYTNMQNIDLLCSNLFIESPTNTSIRNTHLGMFVLTQSPKATKSNSKTQRKGEALTITRVVDPSDT